MQRRSLIQLGLTTCLLTNPKVASNVLAKNKQTLKIATMVGNDILNQITSNILQHAYRQLHLEISVISMPNERALQFANDGEVDGALFRVRNINQAFTNLIIVPTPLLMVEFAVFSAKHKFDVNGWGDLAPYKIGYLRGIRMIEDNTKGMTLEDAPSLHSAFKKMLLGRSDIVICEKMTGISIIKELKLKNVRMLKTALPTFPIFHFLHKKHSALIPELSDVLITMRQNQTIEQIRLSILEQLKLIPS